MAMTKPVTVNLTDAEEAHLRDTAQREGLSVDDVVSRMVQRQMDYDAWYVRQVRQGMEEADRGELIPHEDVVAEALQRRAELLARKAAE